jgi:hypothetical protein
MRRNRTKSTVEAGEGEGARKVGDRTGVDREQEQEKTVSSVGEGGRRQEKEKVKKQEQETAHCKSAQIKVGVCIMLS